MTVENIPHWTIRPNWAAPVAERLEWQTAVLSSPSAAEQRFSLRWSPRRSFEFTVQPHGQTRTLFDMAVGTVGVDPWYIPIWHDGTTLTATLSTGASSLAIDTANREFRSGSFVMLRENDFVSEVLEIDTIAGGAIEFVDGPARDWSPGARIYPALKARLADQPSMTRLASRTLSGSVRFEVVGENDWTGAEGSLTTYSGSPVLTVPPNEVSDLTHAYARLFDEQDNSVGVAERSHTSDIGLTIQGYNWTALGRQQHAEMRSLLYTLAGRREPVWLPTFADDLVVVEPIDAADTSIEVVLCGFTAYGGARENREHIQIVLRDGTRIHRRITGSSLTGDNTEILVLSVAVGVDVTPAQIKRVSFMALCRQDTDQVEFVHLTDNKGVSQIGTTFRSAPNIRDAEDTGDAEFPGSTTTAGACGDCTPGLTAVGSFIALAPAIASVDFPSSTRTAQIYATNLEPSTDGAFGFAYMQGDDYEGRFVVVSDADVISTRTSTHDSDAVSTAATYATWTSDGRFLVLTGSTYPFVFGGESDIKARFFDDDGTPDGGATQIDGDEVSPGKATLWGIAADDTGGYFYAHTESNGGQIFLGHHDSAHADEDTRVTVVSSADKWEELYRCVVRSGNVIAVVYQRYFASGKEARLVISFYDLALSPLATNVEISDVTPTSDTSFDQFIGLRAASGGRFAVVWTDQPDGESDFTDSSLRVRFFLSSGTAEGASDQLYEPGLLEPPFADPPTRSPLSFDISASGNYIVVAENVLSLDGFNYVREQVLSVFEYDGVSWTQVQQIATDDAANPAFYDDTFVDYETSVTRLADGTFVATYEHIVSESPYQSDVRARRFVLTECL